MFYTRKFNCATLKTCCSHKNAFLKPQAQQFLIKGRNNFTLNRVPVLLALAKNFKTHFHDIESGVYIYLISSIVSFNSNIMIDCKFL